MEQQRQFKTAKGHEEPYATQFSVFLANRVGQLKDLMTLFSTHSVDVLGISIVDSTDWAVIRCVFSDANTARELLISHKLPFTESHVMLVEVEGTTALSQVCSNLLSAEINVHFAYPLTIHSNDNPVMVFHVDDHVLATEILLNHDFTLLGSEDLRD